MEKRLKDGDSGGLRLPVAMLLNKWDRTGLPFTPLVTHDDPPGGETPAEHESPRDGEEEIDGGTDVRVVEDWLAAHPYHQELANVLSNGVSEKSGGGDGTKNFAVFPVSALGRCETVEEVIDGDAVKIERPITVKPLASRGLEDAIVWAARRHDELAVEDLERETGNLSYWRPSPLFGTDAALLKRAVGLRRTVPNRARRQRIRDARGLVFLKTFTQAATAVAAVVSVWIAGEALWDRSTLAADRTLVADREAAPAAVREAEDRLIAFADAGPLRHVALKFPFNPWGVSDDDLTGPVEAGRAERERRAWATVLAAEDVDKRAARAEVYLAGYPNGGNVEEAKQIVGTIKEARDDEAFARASSGADVVVRGARAADYLMLVESGELLGNHFGEASGLVREADEAEDLKAWESILGAESGLSGPRWPAAISRRGRRAGTSPMRTP